MKKENGILTEVTEEDVNLLQSNPTEFWKGVTAIGESAFFNLSNLKEIVIPNTIREVWANAFFKCTNLKELKMFNTLTSFDKSAINESCKLETIQFVCANKTCDVSKQNFISLINALPIQEVEKALTNKKLKNILKQINFSGFDSTNFVAFYKFATTLGLMEHNDNVMLIDGKEIKVSDVAFEIMQSLIRKKEISFETMHENFSNLGEVEYIPEFLAFIRVQANRKELFQNPKTYADIYRWFQTRKNLIINSSTQLEGDKPTVEENRYKVQEYILTEKGVYKPKWHFPTYTNVCEELQEKVFVGVTEETSLIAGELKKYYRHQRFFDRAVRLNEERKQLMEQGLLTDYVTNGDVSEELSDAITRYMEETGKLSESTQENCTAVISDAADVLDNVFTYGLLPKSSEKLFVIGMLTSCCSKLYGSGNGSLRAAIIHPDLQPLVIRNSKGDIIAYSLLYINREKGYVVANDVEVNDIYRNNDVKSRSIYNTFKKAIVAFVEQYNSENPEKPIMVVKCGLSPKTESINKFITENPEGYVLPAVNFDEYKFAGKGSWPGDWQHHQYVIWCEEGREFELY